MAWFQNWHLKWCLHCWSKNWTICDQLKIYQDNQILRKDMTCWKKAWCIPLLTQQNTSFCDHFNKDFTLIWKDISQIVHHVKNFHWNQVHQFFYGSLMGVIVLLTLSKTWCKNDSFADCQTITLSVIRVIFKGFYWMLCHIKIRWFFEIEVNSLKLRKIIFVVTEIKVIWHWVKPGNWKI